MSIAYRTFQRRRPSNRPQNVYPCSFPANCLAYLTYERQIIPGKPRFFRWNFHRLHFWNFDYRQFFRCHHRSFHRSIARGVPYYAHVWCGILHFGLHYTTPFHVIQCYRPCPLAWYCAFNAVFLRALISHPSVSLCSF